MNNRINFNVIYVFILVFGVGVNELLIVIYGINHYSTSYNHVHEVLSMSTVHHVNWRALGNPIFSHAALISIKLTHFMSGMICLYAVFRLLRSKNISWHIALSFKNTATLGIGLACLLYFIGFSIVVSNWFLLWMSPSMNTVPAAENIFFIYMLIILFVNQKNQVDN